MVNLNIRSHLFWLRLVGSCLSPDRPPFVGDRLLVARRPFVGRHLLVCLVVDRHQDRLRR